MSPRQDYENQFMHGLNCTARFRFIMYSASAQL